MGSRENEIGAEAREFELGNQLDAASRILGLLGGEDGMSIRAIVEALAQAEAKANFFCGFGELKAHQNEVSLLETAMVERGIAKLEGGILTLTDAGKARSEVPLPPAIEAELAG